MKTLKILYYISVGICLLQLFAYLFMPFGGPMTIIGMIRDGNTEVLSENHRVIILNTPAYNDNPAAKYLHILSSVIMFIYFSFLLICISLPVFYKINSRRKYKIGIALCIIAPLVFFIGNLIWRHLVRIYLGV